MIWNEEDDKALAELWKDKSIPAAEIGERLDPPRTKNSVIGRAHRLGLHDGDGARKQGPVTGIPRPPRVPPPPRLKPKPWEPLRIPYWEAVRGQCRAEAGKGEDGLPLVCGLPVPRASRLSYCAYHLRAYTYPPRRR